MYKVIGWPEVQDLMDKEGFDENAHLATGVDAAEFGPSAYFVDVEWLHQVEATKKA